jgi:hypothetical protein
MKDLVAMGLAVGLSALCHAEPEMKGSPGELREFLQPPTRTVTIFGTGEETTYTDVAKVEVITTTEARQLGEALEQNGQLRSSLYQRYGAAGIPAERVSSAKFSSSPQYGWFGRKPTAYNVVNRLTVTVQNEDELVAVARSADALEGVEVGNVRFEHSREDEFQRNVRAAAIEDATAKARSYADRLGLELIPVSFSDSSATTTPSAGARVIEEIVVTASMVRERQQPAPPHPSFDEVTYHARVDVTFEVLPPGARGTAPSDAGG